MLNDLPSVFSRIKSALRRRGRSEDADDIMHDAWIHLACFQSRHTVKEPEAFLMRAALNLSVDAHRASARRGEEVQPEDALIFDSAPAADDVVLARERMARLNECLSEMNEKTRAIFLASKLDGMTYNEIAKEFGMTRSGVEWHIAKAVLAVASWMEGW